MNREQLIEELEAYLRHIIFASDCLVSYKSILDGSSKYNDQINIAPGFFSISMNALSKCLCIELAKLFVGSGSEKTMQKLIGIVNANQNLFPKEKKTPYHWADDPHCPPMIEIEKINIKADLKAAEEQLLGLEPIISRLKSRRNHFLAHNDPKYFDGTQNPSWDFPISISDVQALIYFSAGFCNKLLSHLDDRIMAYQSSNSNDLEQLLLRLV